MKERRYYVYMLQSVSRRALYTGVTNNPFRRKEQHALSDLSTFAGHYRATRLVYLEVFEDVRNAIRREKQIKGWTRAKKDALITAVNPHWEDLSMSWNDRFKPTDQNSNPTRLAEANENKRSFARTTRSG